MSQTLAENLAAMIQQKGIECLLPQNLSSKWLERLVRAGDPINTLIQQNEQLGQIIVLSLLEKRPVHIREIRKMVNYPPPKSFEPSGGGLRWQSEPLKLPEGVVVERGDSM